MTEAVQDYIKRSPFAVLASADADGNCDASPRGGKPGFVKVIDEKTLLIPDIAGNKLFQSFSNVESNPKIGLLFFIPGEGRTARVNGRVRILDKAEMEAYNETFEVFNPDEKTMLWQGMELKVDEAFTHCPRAFTFSNLWGQ